MGDFRRKLATIDIKNSVVVTEHEQVAVCETAESRLSGNNDLPKSVVISLNNPCSMLKALVALDGCVANLVLMSAATPNEEVARRMSGAGNYIVVSDMPGRENSISCEALFSQFRGSEIGSDTTWQLSTSGTTALPKQVAHSFASLTRSTKIGGGEDYAWGQLYDPYRFAGLQVVLQAILGGSNLVFPNPKDELSDQLAFFQKHSVNALSATPTLWRKILMTEQSRDLPLRSITLGGEIADDQILAAVARSYPDAKVRHIYASTEAGTGFAVSDGLAGFPTSFLEKPSGGLKMKIENDTLMIFNPLASRGYIGEESDFVDDQGYINSGDSVKIVGDRVIFLGRGNGVINVGGNKVYPEYVENILLGADGVKMVRITGTPNSIVGALVVAEVIVDVTENEEDLKRSLRDLANEKLLKHERPVKFKFVDTIKHTDNGKVNRR